MGYQGNYMRWPAGPQHLNSSASDYLLSANGVFILVQQSDGNLVLYHGTGPSDLQLAIWATNVYKLPNHGTYLTMQGDGNLCNYAIVDGNPAWSLWCSGSAIGSGSYIALLENDGNFKVCRGNDPSHPGPVLWQTGVIPAVSAIELANVVYKTDQAKLTDPQIVKIQDFEIINDSDVQQEVTERFELEVTVAQSWEAQVGVKVGVEAKLETGIPFLANGEVKVGIEASFEYTWGTAREEARSEEYELKITVPPHSTVKGQAILTEAQIVLPYTADITYVYANGVRITAPASGIYQGSSESSLEVRYEDINMFVPLPVLPGQAAVAAA